MIQEKQVKSKKFYTSYSKLSEIKLITIGLASPDLIKQWAEKTLSNGKILGEVINANTLHHKTFKPQKGGLFCERIFGPLKDFECSCGKLLKSKKEEIRNSELNSLKQNKLNQLTKINKTKSIFGNIIAKTRNFCNNCEVEYTWSVIRRYQLGYINLISPVTHIWYLKGNPSYLSILLGIKKRQLESITYSSETLTLENALKGKISSLKSSDIVSSWKRLKKQIIDSKTLPILQKNKINMWNNLRITKIQKREKIKLNKISLSFLADSIKEGAILKNQRINPNDFYTFLLKSHSKFNLKKLKKYYFKFDLKKLKMLSFLILQFKKTGEEYNYHNFETNFSPKQIFKQSSVPFYILLNLNIFSQKSIILRIIPEIWNKLSAEAYKKTLIRVKKIFDKIDCLTFNKTLNRLNNLKPGTSLAIPPFPSVANTFFPPLCEATPLLLLPLRGKEGGTGRRGTVASRPPLVASHEGEEATKGVGQGIYFTKKELTQLSREGTESEEGSSLNYFTKLSKSSLFLKSGSLLRFRQFFKSIILQRKDQPKVGQFYKLHRHSLINSFNLIKTYLSNLITKEFSYLNINAIKKNKSFSKINRLKKEKLILKSHFFLELHTLSCFPKSIANFLISKSLIKIKPKIYFEKPYIAIIKNLIDIFLKKGLKTESLNWGAYERYQFKNFLENKSKQHKTQINQKKFTKSLKKFYRVKNLNLIKLTINKPKNKLKNYNIKKSLLNLNKKYNFQTPQNSTPLNKTLYNNIYSLSHRQLWDSENDWNILYYYLSSSSQYGEKLISNYQNRYQNLAAINFSPLYIASSLNAETEVIPSNRFRPFAPKGLVASHPHIVASRPPLGEEEEGHRTTSLWAPPTSPGAMGKMGTGKGLEQVTNNKFNFKKSAFFSGAGMVQQLLNEFNYLEIKKMDKQNRILLYQFNKQIFKLKKKNYKNLTLKEIKEIKDWYKKRDLLIRRTKLIRKLFIKQSSPQSMILNFLPVLPPDLRPIVKIGGQIAASDLNRLYQRVIYRNDRLKKFLKDSATSHSFEMKYAQRLLQEAVDNLIQNGKGGIASEKDSRGRALKSLSEILKGKQGRFRQYLLGKRVDYSGRSVIVVGPKLKLHECGLPQEMALELYLPFLLKKILNQNLARTVVGAKTLIKSNPSLIWQLLREIMQTCPVLLNRAPTLHRLGIQAFQPKLIEGRAILLHPLVCSAFNADFDGDQMAVHIPITVEARAEAWKLMLSRNSILAPSTGDPLAIPSQDMVLGCYYLTTNLLNTKINYFSKKKGSGFYFSNVYDALKAYELKEIDLHANIWLKWSGFIENGSDQEEPIEIVIDSYGSFKEISHKSQKIYNPNNIIQIKYIITTPGKILFNLKIQKCLK